MSIQSDALLRKHYLRIRTDILFDLAVASSAVDATYPVHRADLPRAVAELSDLHARLRALMVGLPIPEEQR